MTPYVRCPARILVGHPASPPELLECSRTLCRFPLDEPYHAGSGGPRDPDAYRHRAVLVVEGHVEAWLEWPGGRHD